MCDEDSSLSSNSLAKYSKLLRSVTIRGIVSQGEEKILSIYRKQNQISNDDHMKAVTSLGMTKDNWDAAVEMGLDDHPDETYGKSKTPQVYYHVNRHDRPEYCNGLIVAPHLRQWYEVRDGEKKIFCREKEERKASWLELFFDLVFVTTVYHLSHTMETHFLPVLEFVILYTAFFRIWLGVTSYSTRYEHHDWMHPVIYCSTMLGLLFMNVLLNDAYYALKGDATHEQQIAAMGFAVCFIFTSLPVLFQYLFATWTEFTGRGFIDTKYKRVTTRHPLYMAIGMFISLIPWIISAALQTAYPLPYWITGLFFMEIYTVVIEAIHHVTAPICVEHWGERLALFVMLHLGESMFAVATDFTALASHFQPYIAAAFGLIIPFAFRRVHFEVEGNEPKEPHALRRNRFIKQIYTSLHWILCMAVIGYAIGFKALVEVNLQETKDMKVLDYANKHEFTSKYYESLQQVTSINCTQFMGHEPDYNSGIHKRGLLEEDAGLPQDYYPPEYYLTYGGNITCLNQIQIDGYYLLYRQGQLIFCGALALMVGTVAILGVLSVTNEEHEKEFLVPKSQLLRVITRVVLLFCLVLLPVISIYSSGISALETICICGSLFFVWAILESFYVLKKQLQDEEYQLY